MAKSVKAASAHTAKSVRTSIEDFNRKITQRAKEMGKTKITAALAFLALCTFAIIMLPAKLAGTAMLYLIADNGKKSGRADGNVYMRNGRVRGFKYPTIVRNSYTTIARGQFSSLSSLWNSLTLEEQLSWNNAIGQFKSDRFGRQVRVAGKQLFVERNVNLANIGKPAINSYVMSAGVETLDLVSLSPIAGASMELAFRPDPTSATTVALVFATAAKSAGTFKPSKSAYRLIATIAHTTASPFDLYDPYTSKFGLLTTGEKYFVRVINIDVPSGKASAITEISAISA